MPNDLPVAKWERVPLSSVFRINTTSIFPWQSPNENFIHYSIPAFDRLGRSVLELGASIESNKTRISESSVLVSKLNPRKPRALAAIDPGNNTCCSTEFICYLPIRPSYNIAVLKCQIGLRYSSSDSILNPFSEAETDETMLEQ